MIERRFCGRESCWWACARRWPRVLGCHSRAVAEPSSARAPDGERDCDQTTRGFYIVPSANRTVELDFVLTAPKVTVHADRIGWEAKNLNEDGAMVDQMNAGIEEAVAISPLPGSRLSPTRSPRGASIVIPATPPGSSNGWKRRLVIPQWRPARPGSRHCASSERGE
jgi:hypothetical protein